jgi:hypothetical protein
MAKKVVATLSSGEKRNMVRFIYPVFSNKKNSYSFKSMIMAYDKCVEKIKSI